MTNEQTSKFMVRSWDNAYPEKYSTLEAALERAIERSRIEGALANIDNVLLQETATVTSDGRCGKWHTY